MRRNSPQELFLRGLQSAGQWKLHEAQTHPLRADLGNPFSQKRSHFPNNQEAVALGLEPKWPPAGSDQSLQTAQFEVGASRRFKSRASNGSNRRGPSKGWGRKKAGLLVAPPAFLWRFLGLPANPSHRLILESTEAALQSSTSVLAHFKERIQASADLVRQTGRTKRHFHYSFFKLFNCILWL